MEDITIKFYRESGLYCGSSTRVGILETVVTIDM